MSDIILSQAELRSVSALKNPTLALNLGGIVVPSVAAQEKDSIGIAKELANHADHRGKKIALLVSESQQDKEEEQKVNADSLISNPADIRYSPNSTLKLAVNRTADIDVITIPRVTFDEAQETYVCVLQNKAIHYAKDETETMLYALIYNIVQQLIEKNVEIAVIPPLVGMHFTQEIPRIFKEILSLPEFYGQGHLQKIEFAVATGGAAAVSKVFPSKLLPRSEAQAAEIHYKVEACEYVTSKATQRTKAYNKRVGEINADKEPTGKQPKVFSQKQWSLLLTQARRVGNYQQINRISEMLDQSSSGLTNPQPQQPITLKVEYQLAPARVINIDGDIEILKKLVAITQAQQGSKGVNIQVCGMVIAILNMPGVTAAHIETIQTTLFEGIVQPNNNELRDRQYQFQIEHSNQTKNTTQQGQQIWQVLAFAREFANANKPTLASKQKVIDCYKKLAATYNDPAGFSNIGQLRFLQSQLDALELSQESHDLLAALISKIMIDPTLSLKDKITASHRLERLAYLCETANVNDAHDAIDVDAEQQSNRDKLALYEDLLAEINKRDAAGAVDLLRRSEPLVNKLADVNDLSKLFDWSMNNLIGSFKKWTAFEIINEVAEVFSSYPNDKVATCDGLQKLIANENIKVNFTLHEKISSFHATGVTFEYFLLITSFSEIADYQYQNLCKCERSNNRLYLKYIKALLDNPIGEWLKKSENATVVGYDPIKEIYRSITQTNQYSIRTSTDDKIKIIKLLQQSIQVISNGTLLHRNIVNTLLKNMSEFIKQGIIADDVYIQVANFLRGIQNISDPIEIYGALSSSLTNCRDNVAGLLLTSLSFDIISYENFLSMTAPGNEKGLQGYLGYLEAAHPITQCLNKYEADISDRKSEIEKIYNFITNPATGVSISNQDKIKILQLLQLNTQLEGSKGNIADGLVKYLRFVIIKGNKYEAPTADWFVRFETCMNDINTNQDISRVGEVLKQFYNAEASHQVLPLYLRPGLAQLAGKKQENDDPANIQELFDFIPSKKYDSQGVSQHLTSISSRFEIFIWSSDVKQLIAKYSLDDDNIHRTQYIKTWCDFMIKDPTKAENLLEQLFSKDRKYAEQLWGLVFKQAYLTKDIDQQNKAQYNTIANFCMKFYDKLSVGILNTLRDANIRKQFLVELTNKSAEYAAINIFSPFYRQTKDTKLVHNILAHIMQEANPEKAAYFARAFVKNEFVEYRDGLKLIAGKNESHKEMLYRNPYVAAQMYILTDVSAGWKFLSDNIEACYPDDIASFIGTLLKNEKTLRSLESNKALLRRIILQMSNGILTLFQENPNDVKAMLRVLKNEDIIKNKELEKMLQNLKVTDNTQKKSCHALLKFMAELTSSPRTLIYDKLLQMKRDLRAAVSKRPQIFVKAEESGRPDGYNEKLEVYAHPVAYQIGQGELLTSQQRNLRYDPNIQPHIYLTKENEDILRKFFKDTYDNMDESNKLGAYYRETVKTFENFILRLYSHRFKAAFLDGRVLVARENAPIQSNLGSAPTGDRHAFRKQFLDNLGTPDDKEEAYKKYLTLREMEFTPLIMIRELQLCITNGTRSIVGAKTEFEDSIDVPVVFTNSIGPDYERGKAMSYNLLFTARPTKGSHDGYTEEQFNRVQAIKANPHLLAAARMIYGLDDGEKFPFELTSEERSNLKNNPDYITKDNYFLNEKFHKARLKNVMRTTLLAMDQTMEQHGLGRTVVFKGLSLGEFVLFHDKNTEEKLFKEALGEVLAENQLRYIRHISLVHLPSTRQRSLNTLEELDDLSSHMVRVTQCNMDPSSKKDSIKYFGDANAIGGIVMAGDPAAQPGNDAYVELPDASDEPAAQISKAIQHFGQKHFNYNVPTPPKIVYQDGREMQLELDMERNLKKVAVVPARSARPEANDENIAKKLTDSMQNNRLLQTAPETNTLQKQEEFTKLYISYRDTDKNQRENVFNKFKAKLQNLEIIKSYTEALDAVGKSVYENEMQRNDGSSNLQLPGSFDGEVREILEKRTQELIQPQEQQIIIQQVMVN